VLVDVSDKLLFRRNSGSWAQEGSCSRLDVFWLQVFVKKRGNAKDWKDKSAWFLAEFFWGNVFMLADQEGIMVEESNSAVVEEVRLPEDLGEVFEVVW